MVCAPLVRRARSAPFDTAMRPLGTVIDTAYVALSRGVSLTGNQVGEPCGSLATNAPSSVGMKPSSEPSGSVTGRGRAAVTHHDGEAVPLGQRVARA